MAGVGGVGKPRLSFAARSRPANLANADAIRYYLAHGRQQNHPDSRGGRAGSAQRPQRLGRARLAELCRRMAQPRGHGSFCRALNLPMRWRCRALVLTSHAAFGARSGVALVAMITSAKNSDWPLNVAITDLTSAGLKMPCLVRAKLNAIDLALIARKIGTAGGRGSARC